MEMLLILKTFSYMRHKHTHTNTHTHTHTHTTGGLTVLSYYRNQPWNGEKMISQVMQRKTQVS